MIQNKININGKSVAVCKVEKKETISILLKEQTNTKTFQKSNIFINNDKLKQLLLNLVISKQKFEVALLKAKLNLEHFKSFKK